MLGLCWEGTPFVWVGLNRFILQGYVGKLQGKLYEKHTGEINCECNG